MSNLNDDSAKTKTIRLVAWGTLIVAGLFPVISTWSSNTLAFDAGRFMGQLVMGVFLVAVVAFAVFRKSSEQTKAKVSLTIGILALVYSVGTTMLAVQEHSALRQAASNYAATVEGANQAITNADTKFAGPASGVAGTEVRAALPALPTAGKSEKEVFTGLLNQMAAIRQQQAKKIIALNERFGKVSLEGALTPENLVNPLSINAARVTLKEFGKLVSERDALFSDFAKEGEAVLKSSEFQPTAKTKALQGIQSNWVRQKKLLDDLSLSQRSVIDAVTKILNLSESNLRTLVVKDGNILFGTQEQLDVYQAQMARIAQSAKAEERATLELQKLAQEVQNSVENDLKAMQK